MDSLLTQNNNPESVQTTTVVSPPSGYQLDTVTPPSGYQLDMIPTTSPTLAPTPSKPIGPLNEYVNSEEEPPEESYARNKIWAKSPGPNGYVTKLSPEQEARFQTWAHDPQNWDYVQHDMGPTPGYDIRGWFQAMEAGDPRAKKDPETHHFNDYWKTPYSGVYSGESKYALPDGPHWTGNDEEGWTLVAPNGSIVLPPWRPPVYDSGPLKGKTIEGMVKAGNIDVNHRPIIKNDDGTSSSIFSVTIPLDRKGQPWMTSDRKDSDWGKAPYYALVPTIVNGKFLTVDGKIPPYANKPDSTLTTAQKKLKYQEMGQLEREATNYYSNTGENLGVFVSPESAEKYATKTHAYGGDGTKKKVYAPSGSEPEKRKEPAKKSTTKQQ